MREHGYDTVAKKCDRQYHKLKAGGNIMRKGVEIPKDKIGAFVGHMPTNLTHPDEDRFLTVREALSIMKLPNDFELLNPKRSLNHICQNVPVTTAEHPAAMVKKYLEGRLDLVDTDFMVQNNKNKSYEYEKSPLQLDQFML
jgi:site-specific DNA-cytosine methylase